MVLIIILVVIALVIFMIIGLYNSLVQLRVRAARHDFAAVEDEDE